MSEIRPIETEYDGRRFRSRGEARLAVFWNEIGVRYSYEQEGYRLSNGRLYLPDFWIPEWDAFVEMKPNVKSEIEDGRRAAKQLAADSGKLVLLFVGELGDHSYWVEPYPDETGVLRNSYCDCRKTTYLCDHDLYLPKFCPCFCLGWHLDTGTEGSNLKLGKEPCEFDEDFYATEPRFLWYSWALELCESAYNKAKRARFEFDERGGPSTPRHLTSKQVIDARLKKVSMWG